jgi:hypothetical protein
MKLLLRRLDRHATRLERDINDMAEAFVLLSAKIKKMLQEGKPGTSSRNLLGMWQLRWQGGIGSMVIWCRTS